ERIPCPQFGRYCRTLSAGKQYYPARRQTRFCVAGLIMGYLFFQKAANLLVKLPGPFGTLADKKYGVSVV
ncbi:MAG: hypothetical protein ABL962_17140, partial [Fimbriimonadaceae bacterium]